MRKAAVIGAGSMGVRHATAYTEIAGVKPVAVMDVRREAAEALANMLGAAAFSDFDSMLTAEPDIVDICVPTPLHAEYAVRAAAAGKHIVIEKPMALTTQECRDVLDAARKAGVTIMVGHVVRFFTDYAVAKTELDARALGTPRRARAVRTGVCPGRWFADFKQSGGVILDLMVHDFDWLRWLFGEAEEVSAKALDAPHVEDARHALVTIRFRSGVIAEVEGDWANPARVRSYEIEGDEASLKFDNESDPPVRRIAKDGSVSCLECHSDMSGCMRMLTHFIESLKLGTQPCITGNDGLRAVEIALAAQESIRTGTPVAVGKDSR